MPKSIQIQINPQVLIWAREEAGYKKEEIAGKLKIPTSRYIDWELGKEDIPLGYLKKIANYFKRQLAVFLLPAPPPKIKIPAVCKAFTVPHLTMEEFLEDNGWRLGFIKD